jgi:hypothetical protein
MVSHNVCTRKCTITVLYLVWRWFSWTETCRRIFNIDYQYMLAYWLIKILFHSTTCRTETKNRNWWKAFSQIICRHSTDCNWFWKGVLRIIISHLFFMFFGAKPPPSWPGPPHSRGFCITHNDALQLVGLLWTSDQLVVETSTWKHTTFTTDIYPCPPVGFEPTISAYESSQTYALDFAATGTGNFKYKLCQSWVRRGSSKKKAKVYQSVNAAESPNERM